MLVGATGVLELTFKYEFNKKNNTIGLTIDQRSVLSHYLAKEKYLSQKNIESTLNIHTLYSKDYLNCFGKVLFFNFANNSLYRFKRSNERNV